MIRCSIDSHVISKFSEDCHGVGNTYHFMARRLTEGYVQQPVGVHYCIEWILAVHVCQQFGRVHRKLSKQEFKFNLKKYESGGWYPGIMYDISRFFLISSMPDQSLWRFDQRLASTGSSPWRWRRPLLVHPGGRYLGETWHRKSMNIWRREHLKKSWLSLVKSIVILVKSWLNLERTFAEHLF